MATPRSPGRWLPGFGVILIGCFFLTAGVAARLRHPVGVIDLVDGGLIAAFCFVVGAVMIRRAR